MATPPSSAGQANKVVVAYLDHRRVKGFVYNFSAVRDVFQVFPYENSPKTEAIEVKMKDLKAVFFVKDFVGDHARQDSSDPKQLQRGRKMEVTFRDGEKIIGATEAYHPKKLGFYVFPADPESNNIRIFVVNQNVTAVKFF